MGAVENLPLPTPTVSDADAIDCHLLKAETPAQKACESQRFLVRENPRKPTVLSRIIPDTHPMAALADESSD